MKSSAASHFARRLQFYGILFFLMLPGIFVRSDSTLYFFLLIAALIGIALVVAIFGDLFLRQRWFVTFIVAATIVQFGALLVGQRMSEMLLPYYLAAGIFLLYPYVKRFKSLSEDYLEANMEDNAR